MDVVRGYKLYKRDFGRMSNANYFSFIENLQCLETMSADNATKLSLEVGLNLILSLGKLFFRDYF